VKGKAEETSIYRVRICRGWDGAGREGRLLAWVFARQRWAVVLWDDEEDPDCFKAAGLEEIRPLPARRRKAAKRKK
jgi:hypothetical protein